jgi:hypothetical protein
MDRLSIFHNFLERTDFGEKGGGGSRGGMKRARALEAHVARETALAI